MPTVDFLPFATDPGANVVSQAAWLALAQRTSGFEAGIAQSDQLNKAWRQSAFMAAALATLASEQTGSDALDDGDLAAMVTLLEDAINAMIAAAVPTIDDINIIAQGGTSGGAANLQTMTTAPVIAYAAGQIVAFKAGFANSAALQVNVNALGARDVKKWSNGAVVDLASGDVAANQMVIMIDDGTRYIIISPLATGLKYPIGFTAGWTSIGTALNLVDEQVYGYVVAPFPLVYLGEVGYAETAPTGDKAQFDILKNGVSIYTTLPEIAAGANTLTAGAVSGTVSFAAGDRIQFKCKNVGSGTPGAQVGFTLNCRQA